MGSASTRRSPLEQVLLDQACVPRVLAALGHDPRQARALDRQGQPVFFALAGHPKAKELLESFLAAGVDLNQRDKHGRSFFHHVLLQGSPLAKSKARAKGTAWLPVLFPTHLADWVLSKDPDQWFHAEASGKRALVVALEANHLEAVTWLMSQGVTPNVTHAAAGFQFAAWVWALALPSASAACLEACFPRGTLPPLHQGERQFVGSYAKEVLQSPQHSLMWLEKMAAWEQRGGKLMTVETLELTDQLVRAYRRSLALEGPLGFVVRERQRIRLQETGYPFRWEAMNAWCLQHRLDQQLGAGTGEGRRGRL